MITLDLLQRIWQMIEPPQSVGSSVEAHELEMIDLPNGHPLITIDVLNQRHLLIPIRQDEQIVEDKQSAGVHVLASQWTHEGIQILYVDVVCLKPHLNSLFDMIVFDIVEALSKEAVTPDLVCRRVLVHWRELLQREVSNLPSREALIGVFGELWTLREIARFRSTALNAWLGPNSARHDVFTGKTALEIKTSTQRRGRTVVIHGHDQLEAPSDAELYLAAVRVEEVPGLGEGLSDLVKALIEIGCDRMKLLTLLANLDFTADVIEKCSDTRFRVVENRVYHVDDDFPRIILSTFKADELPNRIFSISYEIDLSFEPPYPLSADQTQQLYQRIANETYP